MKIVIVKDYDEMSKAAAELAVSLVQDKPHAVLSFATGSTPLGMYAKLASHHKMGLDFSGIKAFHLDEYIGLSPDDPMSYSYYLDENVFTPLEIPKEHIFVHNSDPEQVEQHAREYDRKIEAEGGIDLQVLGIGENGHIAFLEPADRLPLETGLVELTKDTIEVNSRFFEDEELVPHYAMSLGVRTIFRARKIILLANGVRKHDAIRTLLDNKHLDPRIPASCLQLHADCTLIVDEAAYTGQE
ncbi:MAG: glucosamine-6-phosphate deaminase [Tissierellia bacterium]|jgi:glucosamine-6-phosphate deaminase|nr:glucosamine-6-phosphate deaminase [Bacillota bacterium]NLK59237.1 glucosamine-6-phosphate deaminase [Tissierellia bacterium]